MIENLSIAIKAAIKAGNEIMRVYNDPKSDFQVEKKADNSPLTIADKNANEIITSLLDRTMIPILSEEGREIPFEERAKWPELWIVDPLDGTKEFIKRNGEFTVNIALVRAGIPMLGVIYLPAKQMIYMGVDGVGAFKAEVKNPETLYIVDEVMGAAVRIPQTEERNHVVVVASRSHLSPETEEYIAKIKADGKEIDMISSGSSIKICLVAEGSADVYPRFAPTMEWDTAAGHAIARAAGREIYQIDETTPLVYNKENLLNPWFIVK
ncbi:MAG: 3'(2'),5'-bisphosphate nucleotidase CysQ [Bacteroidales bacterium]